jgi:hypothetical protein
MGISALSEWRDPPRCRHSLVLRGPIHLLVDVEGVDP